MSISQNETRVGEKINLHQHQIGWFPDLDCQKQISSRINSIRNLSDLVLGSSGVTYDPTKTVLRSVVSVEKEEVDGLPIDRIIRVEWIGGRTMFSASDTTVVDSRGISGELLDNGSSNGLSVYSCARLPLDQDNASEVAGMLDISGGVLDVSVAVVVQGMHRRLLDDLSF